MSAYSCNACLQTSSELVNICEGTIFRELFKMVQILLGRRQKLDKKGFWICLTCQLMLQKIQLFQQQLCRSQKNISSRKKKRKCGSISGKVSSSHSQSLSVSNDKQATEPLELIKIEVNDHIVELNDDADIPDLSPNKDSDHLDVADDYKSIENSSDKSDYDDDNQLQDNNAVSIMETSSDLELNYDMKKRCPTPLNNQPHVPSTRKRERPLCIYPEEVVLPLIEDITVRFLNNVKCGVCDFTSESRDTLISHMLFEHENETNNWCRVCNNLLDEQESHKCEDSFICKLCDLPCSDAHSIVKHLYGHCARITIKTKKADGVKSEISSTRRKRYACSNCKMVLTNGAKNRSHKCHKLAETTEKARSDKLRVCSYCSKTFKNAVSFLKHLRTHSEKPSFVCRFCDKICTCKSHLVIHERIHTGEKPYVCEHCGKGFAQRSQWTTHMTHHTGRTVKCDQCDKTYGRTADLKVHIRRIHLGQKPEKKYLCTMCGYASHSTSKLEQHMSIHTNERKYPCDLCEMMFKDKGTLMKHKKVHYGEKPHKCPVCPYRCVQKSNLKQHAKKHANEAARLAAKQGDQVYSCDDCNKPFTTHELLLEHIRSTHAKIVN